MICRLLGSRSASVFDVQNGQLPRSTASCEAYVITGSSAGVYDGLPWIDDLMVFLRSARRSSKLIGICFGHQVMAQAFLLTRDREGHRHSARRIGNQKRRFRLATGGGLLEI